MTKFEPILSEKYPTKVSNFYGLRSTSFNNFPPQWENINYYFTLWKSLKHFPQTEHFHGQTLKNSLFSFFPRPLYDWLCWIGETSMVLLQKMPCQHSKWKTSEYNFKLTSLPFLNVVQDDLFVTLTGISLRKMPIEIAIFPFLSTNCFIKNVLYLFKGR